MRGGEWDGAVLYAEKNWGPRFTEHWWWGQAQGFPGADACVAFAGGRVLGGAPTAVVVRVEDRVLRLSPPLARTVTAVGRPAGASTPAPRAGTSPSRARRPARLRCSPCRWWRSAASRRAPQQYLAGRLRATVRRGRRVWWSGESDLAGLERWL